MLKPHGNYRIEWTDDILGIHLEGDFNEEALRVLVSEAKQMIENRGRKPFSYLLNLLQFTGATPEAFEVAEQYNQWLLSTAITRKAIVSVSRIIERIDQDLIPSQRQLESEFFHDLKAAMNWLKSE